ncbi:MAG: hypothetical protein EPO51_17710 [Phenylobacterium sp.]|uniref:hypothetical protein n=1 Tax=Phenylobacterium sp. TaxID=1871053 RepID=UPI0012272FF0|nr:hypothetical protein [Phenylobacterium sp.]TAJ70369.1 MAG: hypothetical protein EPO51_17710 [Phenylobacterium sp.]
MADEPVAARAITDGDWADDPETRARQIDALMAGPPADFPPIIVIGDEAVFGIHPVRSLEHTHRQPGGHGGA